MCDAPTPEITNYSLKIEHENNNFKLDLGFKNNNLIISVYQINSFPSNQYEGEFSKSYLEKLSKFFLLFDNLEDSLPALKNKLEKKEILISLNEDIFKLTFQLNIMNLKDPSFELKKKKGDLNSTIQSLCEIIQQIREKNIEYENEIKELKNEIKEIKEKLLPLKEENNKKEKEKDVFKDSNIINNIEEKQLLENWIKPNSKIKTTLLYQVSRDGDRTSTFTSKVSNKSATIIILKTTAGYRFGGYTANTWEITGDYKKDELAFVFSIDKKKKYNIKKENNGNAIYHGSDRFSFGNGHDFAIFDQCKTSKSNYCNFPYAYTGGEKSELTGGQNNFLVSECEVYHIEFI